MTAAAWAWHTRPLARADAGGAAVTGAWLARAGRPAAIAEVLDGWVHDPALQALWRTSLAALPYAAWAFELPPMGAEDLGRRFECVFVDHPALARTRADPAPFAEPLRRAPAGAAAVAFANLGGDAMLVVPLARSAPAAYAHLAAFVREAPAAQVDATFARVAEAVRATVRPGVPRWLGTAGMGVFWLHFRIDRRPKYYRYDPYVPASGWRSHHEP